MKRTLLLLLLAMAFPAFGAATFTPAPRGINPTQYDNSGSIKSGATLTNAVVYSTSGNSSLKLYNASGNQRIGIDEHGGILALGTNEWRGPNSFTNTGNVFRGDGSGLTGIFSAFNQNQFDATGTNIKSGALLTNATFYPSALGPSILAYNSAGTPMFSVANGGGITSLGTNYLQGPNYMTNAANAFVGTSLRVHTNTLYANTNRVGINTTAPLAPLHVGSHNVAGPVDTKILVSALMDNSGAGNSHAFSDASVISRSGGIGYNSFYAAANLAGGIDYDHYAAFQSAPANVGVGVMKNYYGHFDAFSIQTGTTKTNTAFYASRAFLFGGVVENNQRCP